MGFLDTITLLAILVSTLLVVSAITVPFVGTLVRFRANYNPKGLQLDGEGGVQPHTGPVVKSFFGMMKRVKRLEGWAGLYKGIMPDVLSTLFVLLVVVAVVPSTELSSGSHGRYSAPVEGPFSRLAYSILALIVSLPAVIITNRAITTPYKLPWFNAMYSLRILLTPSERRRPWLLYLTPGLFVSEVIRIVYVYLLWDPLQSLVFPALRKGESDAFRYFTLARLSVFTLLVFVSTLVMCPLEVISTRLSIQRNHAASGFNTVPQQEDEVLNGAVYSAADEDVIGLRPEEDPYSGFVDCVKRIMDEEGYQTLFRAWWLVTLFLVVTGLPK